MISPDAEIRTFLQTVDTGGVPIYDRVPDVQAYPYIHIQDLTCTDFTTADQDLWNTELLLDVVTAFDGNHGGRKQADEIGNYLLSALLDARPIDLGQHSIVSAELINSMYMDEYNGDTTVIRKLIRVGMTVEKE